MSSDAEPTAKAELLDLEPRPTAIVCFNDKVAGFDDIDLSEATDPPLTTVRQPLQEMGRIAVTQLMRVLDGHQPEALHIELATSLVIRSSTAAR